MTTVVEIKFDDRPTYINRGLDRTNELLSSVRDQKLFESRFPHINGGCSIFPRLVAVGRSANMKDGTTTAYLEINQFQESDLDALRQIRDAIECRVIQSQPNEIPCFWMACNN